MSSADLWAVGYYNDLSGLSHTLSEHYDGQFYWEIVVTPDVGTGANSLAGVAALPSALGTRAVVIKQRLEWAVLGSNQ